MNLRSRVTRLEQAAGPVPAADEALRSQVRSLGVQFLRTELARHPAGALATDLRAHALPAEWAEAEALAAVVRRGGPAAEAAAERLFDLKLVWAGRERDEVKR